MLTGLRSLAAGWRFRLGFSRAWRRSRIILSAGMPRSGSTWLFNAARLLLRRAEGDGLSSGWVEDWPTLPPGRTLLLKVHDFDAPLARRADVVLYSYRDVRDVLASSKRKFGTPPSVEAARRLLEQDCEWRKAARLVMRYESMLADPAAVVKELAEVLQVRDVDPAAVAEEVRGLDAREPPSGGYDRETLLHPGHITDGRHGSWEGWLDADLLRRIQEQCGDWLTANGYQ
jgi:hypothetical protein